MFVLASTMTVKTMVKRLERLDNVRVVKDDEAGTITVTESGVEVYTAIRKGGKSCDSWVVRVRNSANVTWNTPKIS